MSLKTFCRGKKIVLFFTLLFLNLFVIFPALAASPTPSGGYVPLVNIPGVNPNAGVLTYLSGLYSFLISVVGILAMAVIIYGGLRYLTSAGNPGAVEEAKDAITSAIIGLVLALASWIILSTINPDILVLKPIGVNQFGGYAYNNSTHTCSVDPTGQGTGVSPCVCADGKKITVGKKNAILTFSVSPTVQAASTSVTINGKLTDALTGAPIGGVVLDLYKFNAAAAPGYASIMGGVITTDPTKGTFTGMTTSTCGGTEQWQMYFPGNGTYAPIGSGSQTVTFTNPPGIPCAAANYPTLQPPLATSLCEAACSDVTLAADGAYHCLVAGVKIGTVTDPSNYNSEQLRAMAVYDGTASNPFVMEDKSQVVIEIEKASISKYPITSYKSDSTLDDGICDASIPMGWTGYALSYSVLSNPALTKCRISATPKGVTCAEKHCITDSKGNQAETTLYFTVLAPN